jgi:hypothetical protein
MNEITDQTIKELTSRYGVSSQAVMTLLRALIDGEGTMAQFDHPELGGMGQWSRGGMTMVGEMFNDALKARVNGLSGNLSNLLHEAWSERRVASLIPDEAWNATTGLSFSAKGMSPDIWWGGEFGQLSASGLQNNIRYAYFANARRLAIKTEEGLTIYDTGDHEIQGVFQQQSCYNSLSFVTRIASSRSQHYEWWKNGGSSSEDCAKSVPNFRGCERCVTIVKSARAAGAPVNPRENAAGRVTVIDRPGLESASYHCYQDIRNVYDSLLIDVASFNDSVNGRRLESRCAAKNGRPTQQI